MLYNLLFKFILRLTGIQSIYHQISEYLYLHNGANKDTLVLVGYDFEQILGCHCCTGQINFRFWQS